MGLIKKKHITLLLYFFLFACQTSESPQSVDNKSQKSDNELSRFILPHHQILTTTVGDVNNDGTSDVILTLKNLEEENQPTLKRPLLILTRQQNGQLKLAKKNDEIILCAQCGGMLGDPLESITISNQKLFSINFYGGSSLRWAISYDFMYNHNLDDWVLTQKRDLSFSAQDPDNELQHTIHADEFLQPITFTNFKHSFFNQENKKWKVKASKTFFYQQPDLKSPPAKNYIIQNDTITSFSETKNFVHAFFQNKNSITTKGFLLKKDLQLLQDKK